MNYDSAATDIGPDGKAKKENILARWLRRVLEPDSAAGTAGLIGASMAPGVGEAIDVADLAMAVRDRDLSRGMWAVAGLAIPGVVGGGMRRGIGSIGDKLRLWHGSPAKFDRFDLEHMGSGAGLQVAGRGHYLADTRESAEFWAGGRKSPLRYTWDHAYEPGMDVRGLEMYPTPMGPRSRQAGETVLDNESLEDIQHQVNKLSGDPVAGHGALSDEHALALSYIDSSLRRPSTDAFGNVWGQSRSTWQPKEVEEAVMGGIREASRDLNRGIDRLGGSIRRGLDEYGENPTEKAWDRLLGWRLDPEDAANRIRRGHLYEVEVDARPQDFLNLDAAAMRTPFGRRLLSRLREARVQERPSSFLHEPDGGMDGWRIRGELQGLLNDEAGDEVQSILQKMGAAGVRFGDQVGSLRPGTSNPMNYVLFDDAPISIRARYSDGGLVQSSRVDSVLSQVR